MRTTVVWCPDWPVVVHRSPAAGAVAVVRANRVVATSSAARAQGVRRGLRRREAQGRCPSLVVIERDEHLEARLFARVIARLDELTPRVEVVRPGLVVFPTRGPARYFGGERPMAERAQELVAEALGDGVPVEPPRIGIADGVFAASLAARRAGEGIGIVAPGDSATFLAPFPVRVLDEPDLADVLVRLGIPTLGSLAELDEADVIGRFGTDGMVAHRLARGLDRRPPSLSEPPPEMEVVAELDPPVDRVDQAAFTGKVLADELLARLDARGASCTRIVVTAETEHGEQLARTWRHEGALTAAAVADRVRWQLDGWLDHTSGGPTGGLTRLGVRPDDLTAASGRQLGFWGGSREVSESVARAVARVQGLLGGQAVRVPERRAGRLVDEQVIAVAADTVDLSRSGIDPAVADDRSRPSTPDPWPGSIPGPAPLRLHHPPLPAELVDVRSRPIEIDGRCRPTAEPAALAIDDGPPIGLTAWAGPWPLDERWWDPSRRRRRARFQVVDREGVARSVIREGGQWWVEATYD